MTFSIFLLEMIRSILLLVYIHLLKCTGDLCVFKYVYVRLFTYFILETIKILEKKKKERTKLFTTMQIKI